MSTTVVPPPSTRRPSTLASVVRPWGIRTRFIVALVAFAVVLSASFTALAIRQAANALYTETKERGRMMLQRFAKDVADARSLEDPLEREIRLLVLANRTMLDNALYVQVVFDGEQVVGSAAEGWLPPVESIQSEETSVREVYLALVRP